MKNNVAESIEYLIHRWGGSTSEAILDSACQHFQVPHIEGLIGYQLQNGCAIVLGDPICQEEKKGELAAAFQHYCREQNLSPIYFIATQSFSKWALNHHVAKIMIEIGEELVFDPFSNPTFGHKGAKLRNTIHHAQHLGLIVKEYTGNDSEIEQGIVAVGNTWIKARKGPQIHLGELNFFENKTDKRWLYVENENKIIAMALLSRLETYRGWLLKFLIANPDAPRGTSELLMVSILNILRDEHCRYITYGMVPGDSLGEIVGLTQFSTWIAHRAFKITKTIFKLHHRKLYWAKYHPQTERVFLLFDSPAISFKQMKALISTMKIDFHSFL